MLGRVYQCGLHSPLVVASKSASSGRTSEPSDHHFFDYLDPSCVPLAPLQATNLSSPSPHADSDFNADMSETTHAHSPPGPATLVTSTASPSPIAPPSYSMSAIDCSLWTLPSRATATATATGAIKQDGSNDERQEAVTEPTAPTHAEARPRRSSFSSLLHPPPVVSLPPPPPPQLATACSTSHAEAPLRRDGLRSATDDDQPSLDLTAIKSVPLPGRSMTPSGSMGTTASHGVSLSADAADRSELSFTGGATAHAGTALALLQSLSVLPCSVVPSADSPHAATRRPASVRGPSTDEARALFVSTDDDEQPPGHAPPVRPPHSTERSLFFVSVRETGSGTLNSSPSFEETDEHCVTVHGLPTRAEATVSIPTAAVSVLTVAEGNDTGAYAAQAAAGLVHSLTTQTLPPPQPPSTLSVLADDAACANTPKAALAVPSSESSSPTPLHQHCLRRLAHHAHYPELYGSPSRAEDDRSPDRLLWHDRRRSSSSAGGSSSVRRPFSPEHPLARPRPAATTPLASQWVAHTPLTRSVASVHTDARAVVTSSHDSPTTATTTVASTPSSTLPTPLRHDLYRGSSCPLKSTPDFAPRMITSTTAVCRTAQGHGREDEATHACRTDIHAVMRSPADDAVHAFTGFPTPIKFSPIPTKVYGPTVHTPSSSAASVALQTPHFSPLDYAHREAIAFGRATASPPPGTPASPTMGADWTLRPASAVTLFGPSSFSHADTTLATPSSSLLATDAEAVEGAVPDAGAPRMAAVVERNRTLHLGQPVDASHTPSVLTPIHESLVATCTFGRLSETLATTGLLTSTNLTSPPAPAPASEESAHAPVISICVPGKMRRQLLSPSLCEESPPPSRGVTHEVSVSLSPRAPGRRVPCLRTAAWSPPQDNELKVDAVPHTQAPVIKRIHLSPTVLESVSTPSCVLSVRSLVDSATASRRRHHPVGAAYTPRASPVDDQLLQIERAALSASRRHRHGASVPSYVDAYAARGYRSTTASIDSWL